MPDGKTGSLNFYDRFAYEFWQFAFVQQEVAKAAESFVEFPLAAALIATTRFRGPTA